MNIQEVKIGMKLKRINSNWGPMSIGSVGEIEKLIHKINNTYTVSFVEYPGEFDLYNYVIAENITNDDYSIF